MNTNSKNIVWQDTIVKREEREKLNGHKSCVLWFTGLSGSGKSTIAREVDRELYQNRIHSYILDGDNIRYGLNSNLGFSQEERKENIRRIGEVSKLFVDAGIITLTACISPYRVDRDRVRSIFDEGEFIEVYVKCSLDECERRDPKGLYKRAKKGEIPNFTGISAPYEEPVNPEILIENDSQPIQQSVRQILEFLRGNSYL